MVRSWKLNRTTRGTVLLVTAWWLAASISAAEEPTGLQAAAALEGVLTEAIAKAEKSVVAIARVKRRGPLGPVVIEAPGLPLSRPSAIASPINPSDTDFIPDEFGTGIVIDKAGLILTCHHVAVDADSDLWVRTADRKPYLARIRAADPRSDLAVLEIDARDLTPMVLGDGAALKKGQIVLTLGNPYAIARDGSASAGWGIVANISRRAGPSEASEPTANPRDKLYHFGTLVQTDAKLNLGSSGGALLNLKGEMVGLTTSLAATAGYEQAAGYAIPVDDLFRRAVETLQHGREVEYGVLGVKPVNLTAEELRRGNHGARLDDVLLGTPARRCGLLVGDVVTHLDGHPLHDAADLMVQVGRQPAAAEVRLTVQRDGQTRQVTVDLNKFPVRGEKVVTTPAPAWRGMRVDYGLALPETKLAAGWIGIDRDACVVITDVAENSPAAAAELRPGMFISHVGGRHVRTPKQFFAAVESAARQEVTLRLAGEEGGAAVRTISPETATNREGAE